MRHFLLLSADSESRIVGSLCDMPNAHDGARLRRESLACSGSRHAIAASEMLRDAWSLGGSTM